MKLRRKFYQKFFWIFLLEFSEINLDVFCVLIDAHLLFVYNYLSNSKLELNFKESQNNLLHS